MATTPKPSLPQRLAGTVEGRTPRFLLGSLALAMVISVLAGIGIGMKVEQHRVKTNAARPVAGNPKKPVVKPAGKVVRGTLRGTLTQVKPKWIALSGPTGRKVVAFAPVALIEVTTAAGVPKIKKGDRILVTFRRKITSTTTTAGTATATTANEIILVTGTGNFRLGRLVASVTSNSITLTNPLGKSTTISTAGAKILKTVRATKADLTTGRLVIVRTLLSPPKKTTKPGVLTRVLLAYEVLVLPANRSLG